MFQSGGNKGGVFVSDMTKKPHKPYIKKDEKENKKDSNPKVIKAMTPEELEAFIRERYMKFIRS